MNDIDYKTAYETVSEIVDLYYARIKRMSEEIERLKEDNEYLNKVNIELSTEKNRLNKNKNDVIEFIVRYLKLNLEAFDTGSLLNKILEIIERGDYIDNN